MNPPLMVKRMYQLALGWRGRISPGPALPDLAEASIELGDRAAAYLWWQAWDRFSPFRKERPSS